ncbi:SAR2788 family putative toxin [Oceanobacillus sojae]|uniref:Uncharacterized protein n=1 Tax=Oceanobacillus sojae TaxID=582851 RepID=A0A511ZR75_9BACI|nr:SAR2788 family putative toxin [Oceanobacillus sojae]GEN89945.1 hypothetical protein OSO01_46840 [Oceanobacillus sojae]
MKKTFVKLLIFVFLFSNIMPIFANAQSSNEDNLVDFSEIEQNTENILTGDEIEDVVETEGYVDHQTDTLVVESSINSEEIEANNIMEVNLDDQEIITSVEIEDEETGELVEYNFDIEVTEVVGEDFKAIFTDLKTGEEIYVDTAQVQASFHPLIVIAILVAKHGVKWAIKKYGKTIVNTATKKYGKKASGKTLSKIKFSSTKKLDSHWKDHKREFPGLTKDGYLKRAQSLAGSTSKGVLTKRKKNSTDIVKYNKSTGEFISLTKDDVIKTFFKPKYSKKNKNWKTLARKYFDAQ